ncbi:MAG: carboxypeptidase regulatory-like domain-containing protein [Acidobacteria bacterium]|nr:carboxypeptidase regulatory-like domain-containing protein [Acidobacteriota bacterium]
MSVEARWHRLRASARIACACVFVAACALAASAQTGQLAGSVKLQSADGTQAPVAGASVAVYRTDIRQKFETRTDKSGRFMFAALPFVGTYTVAVSAPGAEPAFRVGVRAGRDIAYDFVLTPGDGRQLTEEEVRAKGSSPGAPAAAPAESEADRQRRAELERKTAEVEEQNKKIVADNETVQRAFDAGNAALTAASSLAGAARVAKYDEAVARYDEGLRARPDEPALLTNKSVALRARGAERYNAAVKLGGDDAAKEAGLEVAKKDFRAAADLASKAVEAINGTPVPRDAAGRAVWANLRYSALAARAEALRLAATRADQSRGEEAARAYLELAAAETDPAKRLAARLGAGRVLYEVGQWDRAAEELRKVLADDPSNVEANLYLGLALSGSTDKARMKEAAIYLQRFLDAAPPTHPMRADAKAMLEYLKAP